MTTNNTPAELLYFRLLELKSTSSAVYLTINGKRFLLAKLMSVHPFYNNDFNLLVITPELKGVFDTLSFPQAIEAVRQAVEWIRLKSEQQRQEDQAFNAEQQLLLQTHVVAVDVMNGEYFLWNNNDRKISEWSVKAYFERFTAAQIQVINCLLYTSPSPRDS